MIKAMNIHQYYNLLPQVWKNFGMYYSIQKQTRKTAVLLFFLINPIQAEAFRLYIGLGAHSFICCPITTKLFMIVIWHKISEK